MLQQRLSYSIFRTDVLREREWNPLHYNFGQAVYVLIARDFAPLSERLQSAKARLEALPGAIAQAKSNLKRSPPKVHTETAISQNKGTVRMVKVELAALAAQVPGIQAQLEPSQLQAVAALEEYGHWLEKDLLPRSIGDFRFGEEKYSPKLHFALESDISMVVVIGQSMDILTSYQD